MVGMFEPFDQEEARRAGADGNLSKPMDPAQLLETVQGLLHPPGTSPSSGGTGAVRPPEIGERAIESFTGRRRILDIFQPDAPVALHVPLTDAATSVTGTPATREDALASRVEAEIRRLAPAIVREIAETVVPETIRDLKE
jgi:hypothetical protein